MEYGVVVNLGCEFEHQALDELAVVVAVMMAVDHGFETTSEDTFEVVVIVVVVVAVATRLKHPSPLQSSFPYSRQCPYAVIVLPA